MRCLIKLREPRVIGGERYEPGDVLGEVKLPDGMAPEKLFLAVKMGILSIHKIDPRKKSASKTKDPEKTKEPATDPPKEPEPKKSQAGEGDPSDTDPEKTKEPASEPPKDPDPEKQKRPRGRPKAK